MEKQWLSLLLKGLGKVFTNADEFVDRVINHSRLFASFDLACYF